jgi:hypothetical protein
MVDVSDLIQQGEGFMLEYKREIPSPHRIAKLMVAFSNSRGGKILIGVNDQGVVSGVRDLQLQKRHLFSAARDFCDPPIFPKIETLALQGKRILLVTIQESRCKPHRWVMNNEKSKTYIRVKDKNLVASKLAILDLQKQRKLNRKPPGRSDIKETFVISYLQDHERISVKEFCDLLNISKRRALRILFSLRNKGEILLHTIGRHEFYTLA